MKYPAKILLVDDIRENLEALESLLRRVDVEVHSALTANTALDLVLRHDFALAVIDVQMPEINGFELANILRSNERSRHIPIIFVTAGGVEADKLLKAYQSGAIDFMSRPLDNHTVRSKVDIFVDLYQQRAALNQQVRALEEAGRTQQDLLDQLQQAQRDLEQAMQLRDRFISVVSHELRTPLNTMKLELYARRTYLENGDFGEFSPEKIEAMVAADERQLDRLVRLINDMTDVSRIRTGQLSMRAREVDLAALIRDVLQQFTSQFAFASCSVQLHVSGDTVAMVDEYRIEQAFINLLTNAIRHCNRKPVDVRVEGDDDSVRVSVRDYGQGIQPEDHARIFQLFERGANERKGSGLGLGLFIANQIVAAHGGSLAVESRLNEGALFAFTLPKRALFAG